MVRACVSELEEEILKEIEMQGKRDRPRGHYAMVQSCVRANESESAG